MTTIDTLAVDQVQFRADGATFIRFDWGAWFKFVNFDSLEFVYESEHLEDAYQEERARQGIM